MPVTFAHILGILVCLFALAREYPEAMSFIGQSFLALWAYRRFLR
ncbi:hypothetical protein [Tautonia sociabilis]|nr:hypothetical protein [Tautonia sociabilis]